MQQPHETQMKTLHWETQRILNALRNAAQLQERDDRTDKKIEGNDGAEDSSGPKQNPEQQSEYVANRLHDFREFERGYEDGAVKPSGIGPRSRTNKKRRV
jgi:hypothetical protein